MKHFSGTVYQSLVKIREDYTADPSSFTGIGGEEFTADDLAYLDALIEDYKTAGQADEMYMLDVMSPINYIAGTDGFDDATPASYWRLRNGSEDGDHGAPAAWLIYQALQKYHPEVESEMGIAWSLPHVWSELKVEDFFEYIGGIMAKEDNIK